MVTPSVQRIGRTWNQMNKHFNPILIDEGSQQYSQFFNDWVDVVNFSTDCISFSGYSLCLYLRKDFVTVKSPPL